jgi:hypothetical protein
MFPCILFIYYNFRRRRKLLCVLHNLWCDTVVNAGEHIKIPSLAIAFSLCLNARDTCLVCCLGCWASLKTLLLESRQYINRLFVRLLWKRWWEGRKGALGHKNMNIAFVFQIESIHNASIIFHRISWTFAKSPH